jgi:hypothetical protein
MYRACVPISGTTKNRRVPEHKVVNPRHVASGNVVPLRRPAFGKCHRAEVLHVEHRQEPRGDGDGHVQTGCKGSEHCFLRCVDWRVWAEQENKWYHAGKEPEGKEKHASEHSAFKRKVFRSAKVSRKAQKHLFEENSKNIRQQSIDQVK